MEFHSEELIYFPFQLTSKGHIPNEVCSKLVDDDFVQIILAVSPGDPSAFICESLDSHVVNSISNVDDLMLTDECPYPLDQACPTVSSSGDVVP